MNNKRLREREREILRSPIDKVKETTRLLIHLNERSTKFVDCNFSHEPILFNVYRNLFCASRVTALSHSRPFFFCLYFFFLTALSRISP